MQVYALSKFGFGSVTEIKEWDTPEFLNALEFLVMDNLITWYRIERENKK